MKCFSIVFIFIILGGNIMYCNKQNQPIENTIPITPGDSFEIEEKELSKLQKEALLGSAKAAFQLYQFYEFSEIDNKKSLYWLTIAAENGDPIGQYNLAYAFMIDSNINNILRAKFWVKKRAEKGDKNAIDLLDEIDEKLRSNGVK